MLYYSTNSSIRTKYSVEQEHKEKAQRIAEQVRNHPHFTPYLAEWIEDGNISHLYAGAKPVAWDLLDLNKGDRAKRLRNLYQAVVNEVIRYYC